MKGMSQRDTRTQLLDAAEEILLEHGLDGLSVRSVTAAAGMNVGAVNYTFGGKDALLFALSQRVLRPVATERIRLIEEVVSSGPYAAEDLLRAYTVPILGMDPRVAPLFVELLIRSPTAENDDRLTRAGKDVLRPGLERLIEALSTVLPNLPAEVLARRLHLLFGAAALYLRDEVRSDTDRQDLIAEMIAVGAAALSAPVSQASAQAKS